MQDIQRRYEKRINSEGFNQIKKKIQETSTKLIELLEKCASEKYGDVKVSGIRLVYLVEKGTSDEPWLIGVEKCNLEKQGLFKRDKTTTFSTRKMKTNKKE